MKIARWIDIGAPIDLTQIIRNGGGTPFAGFLEDDLRPTLSLAPRRCCCRQTHSAGHRRLRPRERPGLQTRFLVTLDRSVGGVAAGTNLAAGLALAEWQHDLDLPAVAD